MNKIVKKKNVKFYLFNCFVVSFVPENIENIKKKQ
jgi:hypothetical protein